MTSYLTNQFLVFQRHLLIGFDKYLVRYQHFEYYYSIPFYREILIIKSGHKLKSISQKKPEHAVQRGSVLHQY